MDLRQLRYFVAVARELHFGRAAAKLHIAQPALSQQIKTLEAGLETLLLVRDNRSVRLTEAGRTLLAEASDLLDRAERARDLVRAVGQGKHGRLRVNYIRSALGGTSTRLVDEFRRRFPAVQLEINTAYTTRNVDELRRDLIDAAFVRPPIETQGALACITLGTEPLVVALPKDHRLARKRRIERADLRDEPLVSGARARGPGFFDSIYRQVWGKAGPRIVAEQPDEEHILAAVAQGMGIAVITESRAHTLNFSGVAIRRFTDPQPQVELGLAWNPDAVSPMLERFLELAKAG